MGLRLESILNSIFEVWGLGLGFWDLEILCRSVTIAGIESMNLVQESKKHELPCLPTLSNYALDPSELRSGNRNDEGSCFHPNKTEAMNYIPEDP